jgi:hypothetical protein
MQLASLVRDASLDDARVLLATIRDLMADSRPGSFDAGEAENATYLRAEAVVARYTPAT